MSLAIMNFMKRSGRRSSTVWTECESATLTNLDICQLLTLSRFLLAQLHLDSLRGKSRVKAVRAALASLSKGSNAYDDAYKNAMARINGQVQDQRELALQTLAWVTCAKRPLRPDELGHALGVEIGKSDIDEDNLPDLQDVLSSCCGLVTITDRVTAWGWFTTRHGSILNVPRTIGFLKPNER